MKVAALVLAPATVAGPAATEVLRGLVRYRRERRDGLGGTQDIAGWGTFVTLECMVAAAVCCGMWIRSR